MKHPMPTLAELNALQGKQHGAERRAVVHREVIATLEKLQSTDQTLTQILTGPSKRWNEDMHEVLDATVDRLRDQVLAAAIAEFRAREWKDSMEATGALMQLSAFVSFNSPAPESP